MFLIYWGRRKSERRVVSQILVGVKVVSIRLLWQPQIGQLG